MRIKYDLLAGTVVLTGFLMLGCLCEDNWFDFDSYDYDTFCGVAVDKDSKKPVDSVTVTALVIGSSWAYRIKSICTKDDGSPTGIPRASLFTDKTGQYCIEYDHHGNLCDYTATDIAGRYKDITVSFLCDVSVTESIPDTI